jgi:hypothetical protein
LRTLQPSLGEKLAGLIGEPVAWVFVIVGAFFSAQVSPLYPILIGAGFMCVAAVGELITCYRCDNCQATFKFRELRNK